MGKGLARSFAFKACPEINRGKRSALDKLSAEWRRLLPLAFNWHWKPFLSGSRFESLPRSGPKSTFPKTRLVTSQKDLMAVAIQGQAKGWASNLQNRFRRALMGHSGLSPLARREMLWINAMGAWTMGPQAQRLLLAAQPAKAGALATISNEASRSMRKMFEAYVASHKLPDPMNLPLQVNQQSSRWEKSKKAAGLADSWLSVATLKFRTWINLPLLAHDWSDARGGERAKTFSLVEKGGEWFAISTQYVAPKPWASPGVEVLAIDLGLKTLIATSEGDLLGRGFLDQLLKYDSQLQKTQKGLRAAGVKRLSECKKYRKLVQRIRGWIKTEVQTQVGRVLAIHQPKKVVVEDLCFAGQSGSLSRRMNRLVRGFGQAVFKQTIKEKAEEFGFEVQTVDPAYSSQTCHRCGFVLRSNREADRFKCKSCGHGAHADVNAAKNLEGRSRELLDPTAGMFGAHALRARWEWTLRGWLLGASSKLAQRPSSCPPGWRRAAGSARMGLKSLMMDKASVERLGVGRSGAIRQALSSKNDQALFDGLRAGFG